jgi:glycosyltransferase involved in cell wall biosynthesis
VKPLIIFTANQSMALFKFRLGVMQFLKNQGYHVIAIAPADSFTDKIVQSGIQFIPVKLGSHMKTPISDVKLFIHLLKLYKKLKPAFIFHYTVKLNIYGNLAAHLAGKIPTISVVPGRGYSFHKRNWLYRLVKLFYRFSLRCTREVWFLNEEDRDFFVSEGMVEKGRTAVLPGEGVNTSYYTPRKVKRVAKQDGLTFLLSGRMLWEKGVGDFVEAARLVLKKYPSTKFHLLGFLDPQDDRVVQVEKIQEWVADGTVSFMGVAEDVRPYYGEGLPRTLLEAASMEIPLITTDHRGCKRAVVHGENGFLCRIRDVNDLATKMMDFIRLTPDKRKKMGNLGRKLVQEQFEEELLKSIYFEKLKEVLHLPSLKKFKSISKMSSFRVAK